MPGGVFAFVGARGEAPSPSLREGPPPDDRGRGHEAVRRGCLFPKEPGPAPSGHPSDVRGCFLLRTCEIGPHCAAAPRVRAPSTKCNGRGPVLRSAYGGPIPPPDDRGRVRWVGSCAAACGWCSGASALEGDDAGDGEDTGGCGCGDRGEREVVERFEVVGGVEDESGDVVLIA